MVEGTWLDFVTEVPTNGMVMVVSYFVGLTAVFAAGGILLVWVIVWLVCSGSGLPVVPTGAVMVDDVCTNVTDHVLGVDSIDVG